MSLLLAIALLSSQTPAPSPKGADRSSEATLKAIFTWAGSLGSVHGLIDRSSRPDSVTPFGDDGEVEFWLSGKKFRIELSGYWGDGFLAVCDGKSLLTDNQTEYNPVVIADAGKSIVECCPALALKGDQMVPFLTLLKGPAAFDELVAKDSPIVDSPDRDGDHVLMFKSGVLGNVTLLYRGSKDKPALHVLEYDNLAWLTEMHDKNPDWFDAPEAGTLTRNRIVLLPGAPENRVFEIAAPKGRTVEDKRKKTGGPNF